MIEQAFYRSRLSYAIVNLKPIVPGRASPTISMSSRPRCTLAPDLPRAHDTPRGGKTSTAIRPGCFPCFSTPIAGRYKSNGKPPIPSISMPDLTETSTSGIHLCHPHLYPPTHPKQTPLYQISQLPHPINPSPMSQIAIENR